MTRLLFAFLVVALALPAEAERPSAVEPPPFGHWGVDLTGRARPQTLASFDAIAASLNESGQGQLGLAIVRTTDGRNPRAWATTLFNRWGVGDKERNNGVLLVFALDDRKSEIVLGDGLGHISTWDTDRIMADDVVANMKRGNLDGAVLDAAASLSDLLKGSKATEQEPLSPEAQRLKELASGIEPLPWRPGTRHVFDLTGTMPPTQVEEIETLARSLQGAHFQLYVLLARTEESPMAVDDLGERLAALVSKTLPERALVLVISTQPARLHVAFTSSEPDERAVERALWPIYSAFWTTSDRDIVEATSQASASVAALARDGIPETTVQEIIEEHLAEHLSVYGSGGVGLLSFVIFRVRRWLRRRPRRCKRCGANRILLDERGDDRHLDAGQRFEERLASVDYDVWWCGPCENAIVLRYATLFTQRRRCVGCGYVTALQEIKTVVSATYDRGGTVEVTERCDHCRHARKFLRHTPRKQRATSSSSSSSGSRSSRSSFGGGSSSGRGSSGSW